MGQIDPSVFQRIACITITASVDAGVTACMSALRAMVLHVHILLKQFHYLCFKYNQHRNNKNSQVTLRPSQVTSFES